MVIGNLMPNLRGVVRGEGVWHWRLKGLMPYCPHHMDDLCVRPVEG